MAVSAVWLQAALLGCMAGVWGRGLGGEHEEAGVVFGCGLLCFARVTHEDP